jgi:hypothetical protein
MVGPEHKRVKGYMLEAFADAFSRYIPALQPNSPHSINEINGLGENRSSHQKIGCEVVNSSSLLNSKELCGCEVESPGNGARDENGAIGAAAAEAKILTPSSKTRLRI